MQVRVIAYRTSLRLPTTLSAVYYCLDTPLGDMVMDLQLYTSDWRRYGTSTVLNDYTDTDGSTVFRASLRRS